MQKVLHFFKQEIVLVVSFLLAAGSAFLVHPDKAYASYIDCRTLALLFCLMTVMAGLNGLGVFVRLAQKLLGRVRTMRGLYLVLCGLCFFSSMLITNDVALITFVPFTLVVLHMLPHPKRQMLLIVCETVAANLGSMLTPIGNPQNLYLFTAFSMQISDFLSALLPYALLSFVLLILFSFGMDRQSCTAEIKENTAKTDGRLYLYLALFTLTLTTVLRLVPYYVPLAATLVLVLILDRRTLGKVDYSLLLTFVFLFIFIGNLGRMETVSGFLKQILSGHEMIVAVLCSQIFSNVPAAILLSGFAENIRQLLIGVNLGGLGTLIASMASLISFKFIARDGWKTVRYLGIFTAVNLIFLVLNLGLWMLIR